MQKQNDRKMTLWYILAAAAVVAADQGLKAWVVANIPLNPSPAETRPFLPGIVRLSYIQNRGAAFGMLQDARWAFLALLAGFCVLVIWALVTHKLTAPWERWLAVIATGGAIANGIDRAVNGYVVDMFELQFMKFAIFNLADFAINVSCIAFVILTLFKKEETKTQE